MKPPVRIHPGTQTFRNDPSHAGVVEKFRQGLAAHQKGQMDTAAALYLQVLKLNPIHFDALHLLGVVELTRGNYQTSLTLICKALNVNNRDANAHYNHGLALQAVGRHGDAIESYDKAVALKPDYSSAWFNRGNSLMQVNSLSEALQSFDMAIRCSPNHAVAHMNRGLVLEQLGRNLDALASYDESLRIRSDDPGALVNRGNVLKAMERLDEAIDSYGRALKVGSVPDFAFGIWLQLKMQICDWGDLKRQFVEMSQRILRDEKIVQPFTVLASTDSLHLQRKAAEIWINARYPGNDALPAIGKYSSHPKIRIGYFSADFHNHPIAYLLADLIESHDRERFEVLAFSIGADKDDQMRRRLRAAFDQFIEVRDLSDMDVVKRARQFEIDIAIDLTGLTSDARPGIFAMRAAPVQVSYLGYLGTMGAEYIDYLIADHVIVPPESRSNYAEKIAYLPSYQANDAKRQIADQMFTRAELGLPNDGFVFSCFNNNYKITSDTFDGWMRILKRVDGSVLFLYAENQFATINLRNEAGMRGVDPNRLVFAKRLPMPEYLARYRVADLFLDTAPYNAGATASDALWAGLPVLTCAGEAFASRVAASLLMAIGLPELVTTTQEQYESTAVELATNRERLLMVKQKLENNRLCTALFDTARFTKAIEFAFTKMYERCQDGSPPREIEVEDQECSKQLF